MSEIITAIKGMNDILPEEITSWQELESIFRQCLNQYGYKEIRLPLLEFTKLFKRSIGELTDIVSKEMYTFIDLNGQSISLRPEGSAGLIRAAIEHNLLHQNQQKLWYMGPMFRHERPQKGRYRQFYQLGVEALGFDDLYIEVELIVLTARIFKLLGIDEYLKLEINTIGTLSERNEYKTALVAYLEKFHDDLDKDSQNRLYKNPLRILDSKDKKVQEIVKNAPKLLDVLSDESSQKFNDLQAFLDELEIPYTVNTNLVRGLDYYSYTVFEWKTDKLGAQDTICAGGRFDDLFKHLGGKSNYAFGFAIGMERLLLLQQTVNVIYPEIVPKIYIIAVGDKAIKKGIKVAEEIRFHFPEWQIINNLKSDVSFKSQFKKADKSKAQFALILGEDEINKKTISFKDLRSEGVQMSIIEDELIKFLQKK